MCVNVATCGIDKPGEGESMAVRTNIYLDDSSYAAARELPRKISMSAVARWVMICASTSDNRELKRILKNNPDLLEVHRYMRPKIMKAFGLKEEDANKVLRVFGKEENEPEIKQRDKKKR